MSYTAVRQGLPATAGSTALGTAVDHLFRRGATYWWQRRVPSAIALDGCRRLARSLRTADPALARRRARACSVAFDHVMLRFMSRPAPTREDLVRVLDDIFRRILQDGERTRAEREAGPPPWTPEPQDDPRYEGLAPEDWDRVPYPPEQWVEEWRDAVMTNRLDEVTTLVEDALSGREFAVQSRTPVWQMLCRLSLIVASRAHAINARREWGNYEDGWPQAAGVPASELPGAAHSAEAAVQLPPLGPAPVPDPPSSAADMGPLISESFAALREARPDWSKDYREHVHHTLALFVSLIGDLPVKQITGEVAELYRDRLKNLPTTRGKGIYAGMSPFQALATANRLRAALQAPGETIPWGKVTLKRKQAESLATANSMKTANKYLTVMTSWGSWMEKGEQRSAWLHRGKCPFSGVSYPKSAVQKESRLAGRNRMSFPKADLCLMLQDALFLDPPPALPSADPEVQLRQAKFWSILIALYTGMRLGEVAMLEARDFCTESGVEIISLVSDAGRSFKNEAGDRKIPLHPDLLKLGLHDFARRTKSSRKTRMLTGMKDSPKQKGANISKWFTRWRRELGIKSARTTFHSFRHNFETALKAKLPGADTLIDQIVGHKPGSMGAEHYTDPLPIPTKAEAIARIDYEIDLSLVIIALQKSAQADPGSRISP